MLDWRCSSGGTIVRRPNCRLEPQVPPHDLAWRRKSLFISTFATTNLKTVSNRSLVEPTGNRAVVEQRLALARQDQESRLKGVFGILGLHQHASADAHHQIGMSTDKLFQTGFVAFEKVSSDKFVICDQDSRL